MRKAKKLAADELRSEYKRSDFGVLVRGKHIKQLQANSNVVVLDPEVADLFPNAAAVNAALRSLAEIATSTGGRYFRATTGEAELDEIYSEISQMEKKELESRLVQNYEDRFQYPLALAVLCLVVEASISERRRRGTSRFRFLNRQIPAGPE